VGVLGEPLTPEIIAAFGLILAGSVLATQSGLASVRRRDRAGLRRRGLASPGAPDEPGEPGEPAKAATQS